MIAGRASGGVDFVVHPGEQKIKKLHGNK